MRAKTSTRRLSIAAAGAVFLCTLASGANQTPAAGPAAKPAAKPVPEPTAEVAAALAAELKLVPHQILYEAFQDNNWDLFIAHADGSHAVNLTHTPEVDELYPHANNDGTKICFLADEGRGPAKVRNLYVMNIDGSGRTLIARNARDPCWNAGGTAIAYLKGEFEEFTYRDYASKGLYVYDLKTGRHRQHPNKDIEHLYNLCWSPDGKWFVATIHGAMGFSHAILAIEADGMKVVNLKLPGCRPDLSADGRHIAWGCSDWALRVADFDTRGGEPQVLNARTVVESAKPIAVYHIDWSPDGKYVAFSRGPTSHRLGFACEMIGVQAPGWDICVADTSATNRYVAITRDGKSHKEPDWVPVRSRRP
jgi:Tol biopolymer transport system component